VLLSILQGYQASGEFLGRAARTRFDYIRHIKAIEKEFGDFPLSALTDRRTRGVFMAWRDRLANRSRRQADYAWTVLALILAWALNRSLIAANPCEKGGRLYRGSRADKIWTADDEARFLEHAPAYLHLPLLLALWTGQRQGDLLRLPWSAYDGTHIRLRQAKTGARVKVLVGAPLKAALDAATRRSTIILTSKSGRPTRHSGHAARAGRMQRGRDRNHHRSQLARCPLDPRCQLSAPRSGARRERDQEARKGNENSQLSAQLMNDGEMQKEK
jgi:integrase